MSSPGTSHTSMEMSHEAGALPQLCNFHLEMHVSRAPGPAGRSVVGFVHKGLDVALQESEGGGTLADQGCPT